MVNGIPAEMETTAQRGSAIDLFEGQAPPAVGPLATYPAFTDAGKATIIDAADGDPGLWAAGRDGIGQPQGMQTPGPFTGLFPIFFSPESPTHGE